MMEMCSITAGFVKLSLFYIVSRKINIQKRKKKKIEDMKENVKTHTAKSFMTTECLIKYLKF